MALDRSFLRDLEEVLPLDHAFQIYHAATTPTPCQSIYTAEPGADPPGMTRENHILAVSTLLDKKAEREVLIFALEVFIYTAKDLTTIFVSKADTTGFLKLLHLSSGSPSVAKHISTAFISHLVTCKRDRQRLVISLFARAQDQYLFPGSIDSGYKRVLDDRTLIKWWCLTLDPILRRYVADSNKVPFSSQLNEDLATASAYLVVPGCETYETRSFFPASTKSDSPEHLRWQATHPLYRLNTDGMKTPPRCLIPRFPDDPKARFLDQLDEEIADSSHSQWRSVKTLEQFWELMAYRQECSAGRLVGFFWLLITYHTLEPKHQIHLPETPQPLNLLEGVVGSHSSSKPSCDPVPDGSLQDKIVSTEKPSCLHSSTDLSNRDKSESHEQFHDQTTPQTTALYGQNGQTHDNRITQSTEDQLLSQEQYDELLSHLLDLDFSSLSNATTSTSSFIAFAQRLTKSTEWGAKIVGRKAPSAGSAPKQGKVNPSRFNVLASNIIRKKKRTLEDVAVPQANLLQEAKTLSAEVVRKKQK